MNKKTIVAGIVIVILLISIPLTIFISSQSQDVRSRADEPAAPLAIPTVPPAATATPACTPPPQVQNVQVIFPYCEGENEGDQCDFSKAGCTWDSLSDATNYNVKITEVDTNTVVSTQTFNAGTTRMNFPITANRTYQCDVAAVNSCGAAGEVSSNSLLCAVEVFETPAPTTPPTTPPTPLPTTPPVVVQPTPIPTIPPSGAAETTVLVGLGGLVLVVLGGIAFLF